MNQHRVDKLNQRRVKLEKQLALAKSNSITTERKLETRKKIIIGAMVLNNARGNSEVKSNLLKKLDQFLTKKSDRQVFGLPHSRRGSK